MEQAMSTRRSFLKQAAGVSLAASTLTSSASSYARILGANDRLHVAVMGLGGRGQILACDFARMDGVSVTDVCDRDYRRCDQANHKSRLHSNR